MAVSFLWIIPVGYGLYVAWVLNEGEYSERHDVQGWFIDRVEYESVAKEEQPGRFWCKIAVDVAMILAIVVFLLARPGK